MLWSGLTRLFRLDDAGAEMVEADGKLMSLMSVGELCGTPILIILHGEIM